MADYEQILSDLKDGVLTLTLNRPDRLNAWTDVMHNELKHAIVTASSHGCFKLLPEIIPRLKQCSQHNFQFMRWELQ